MKTTSLNHNKMNKMTVKIKISSKNKEKLIILKVRKSFRDLDEVLEYLLNYEQDAIKPYLRHTE